MQVTKAKLTGEEARAWLARFCAARQAPMPIPKRKAKEKKRWVPEAELTFFPVSLSKPSARRRAALPIEDQIGALSRVFIDNEQTGAALNRLELMLRKRLKGDFRLMFFTGETRTGKTRVLTEFMLRHPPSRKKTAAGTLPRVPVLYLPGFPGPFTVKGLCASIAHQVGFGRPPKLRIDETLQYIPQQLKELGVQILIIDDAAALNQSNKLEVARFKELFTTILREGICQIVLAGPPALKNFSRHFRFTPMSRFHMDNFIDGDADRLVSLLRAICSRLPLPCKISPKDRDLIDTILEAGAVGSIIALFKSAAVHALAYGADRIEAVHFKAARADSEWDDVIDLGEANWSKPSVSETSFEIISVKDALKKEEEPRVERRAFYTRTFQGPLPVNFAPHSDESFKSFFVRLREANPHFREFVKQVSQSVPDDYFVGSREIDGEDHFSDLFAIAAATQLRVSQLIPMATIQVGVNEEHRTWVAILGKLIDARRVTDHIRWCPLCLKEGIYFRNLWKLAPLRVCLKHRLPLQSNCPRCAFKYRPIPPLGVCNEIILGRSCGTRFDEAVLQKASAHDIALARHVAQTFLRQPCAPKNLLHAIRKQNHPRLIGKLNAIKPRKNDPWRSDDFANVAYDADADRRRGPCVRNPREYFWSSP